MAAGASTCPKPYSDAPCFTCDNAYYIPALEVTGFVCKTHKTSQTAFRGFGGPQGMLVIEDILDRVARTLGSPPDIVRERNFYREGHSTHYGQPVQSAERIERIWEQLKQSSDFAARRVAVDRFNHSHPYTRRGLAITPVKFGISFTATLFNQAGALVLIYRDGSVQVTHGGTEMGQGLFTKIRQIAASQSRCAARSRPPDAHPHRQSAQHVRHRRILGHRSEWRGRSRRLRPVARHTGAGGRLPAALRARRCGLQ